MSKLTFFAVFAFLLAGLVQSMALPLNSASTINQNSSNSIIDGDIERKLQFPFENETMILLFLSEITPNIGPFRKQRLINSRGEIVGPFTRLAHKITNFVDIEPANSENLISNGTDPEDADRELPEEDDDYILNNENELNNV